MAKKTKRGAPQKECPSCGKMIHARSKTCPECQAELASKAAPKRTKKGVRKRPTRQPTPTAGGVLSEQLRWADTLLDSVGGDVHQAKEILDAVSELKH